MTPMRCRPNMISKMNAPTNKRLHMQRAGIEERDDHDRADVVGNGQGQEEDLQL